MGVNESLVLLKDAALIVSAKNNTVITAMDRNEAAYTNIYEYKWNDCNGVNKGIGWTILEAYKLSTD